MDAYDRSQPPERRPALQQAGESLRFLKSWVTAPLRTGAVLPSGRALSRAMADAVDPAVPGAIVELGPGTGVVTRFLLERGIAPDRLNLFELNADFCRLLRAEFPGVNVHQIDAFSAPGWLSARGLAPVSHVVSSLPLFTQPRALRIALLEGMLDRMAPGGAFVQFTYWVHGPVPLAGLNVEASKTRRIWPNVWPAVVWSYRRPRRPAGGA